MTDADIELAEDLRPTAPSGFRVLDCTADPQHPGLYMIDDGEDGYYLPPCFYCIDADRHERENLRNHREDHSRILSTKIGRRLLGWAYQLGVISGYGIQYGTAARCKGCVHAVRFKGRRPYVLGLLTEEWRCLLRFRHWPTGDKIAFGYCSKCLPCADCGSTKAWHRCE